jgi:hypothetical protein
MKNALPPIAFTFRLNFYFSPTEPFETVSDLKNSLFRTGMDNILAAATLKSLQKKNQNKEKN